MKTLFYISVCSLLLGSCSGSNSAPPSKEYYAGEFVYFADAASMRDCATGERIAVSNEEDYLSAEREYSSLAAHGEAVMIEFFGRRVEEQSMEGDRMIPKLVIDSLIGFDQTVLCNPDALVAGIYEGKTPEGKYLVRMKADYTYTQSLFATGRGEQVSSGRWYMCASSQIVFIQDTPEYAASTFEFIPAQQTLAKNSGGKPLILIKVYL